MTVGPDTVREAAAELPPVGHLAFLLAEVELQAEERDQSRGAEVERALEQLTWSPWEPCPLFGASSWLSHATVPIAGDVLDVEAVASVDHETTVASAWRSNGRSPARWIREALLETASGHAETAPTGHHTEPPSTEGTGYRPGRPDDSVAAGSTPAGSTIPKADDHAALRGHETAEQDQRTRARGGDGPGFRRASPERIGEGVDHVRPADEQRSTPAVQRPVPPERQVGSPMQASAREGARPSPTSLAGDTPPATPASGTGAHPARPTHRAVAPIQEPTMHALEAIDRTIGPEIKGHVQQIEELLTLAEQAPEGWDVDAGVGHLAEQLGEDAALAIGLYLRRALMPAAKLGRAERATILEAVHRLEREEEIMRKLLGQLLDSLARRRAVESLRDALGRAPSEEEIAAELANTSRTIRGPFVEVRRTRGGQGAARPLPGADPDLLPDRYVKREPRLAEIREALLRGEDVPGWRLVQEPGVQIR